MTSSNNPNPDKLQSLNDTVTRHDERIKSMIEKHEDFTKSNEKIEDKIEDLKENFNKLQSQVNAMSAKLDKVDGFWGKLFDAFWKLALMILGGAILYALGMQ